MDELRACWVRARWAGLALMLLAGSCAKPPKEQSAEAWVREGWLHFRMDEFVEAEKAFTAGVAKATPAEREAKVNGLYGLGLVATLAHHGEQTEKARADFAQVEALDDRRTTGATGEMGAWAALAMVREQAVPARSDGVVDQAMVKAGYNRIIEKYPNSAAAEEAFVYRTALGVDTLNEADARQAVGEVTTYLATHPKPRLATALYTLLSKAHEILKEYPESLAAAIASVEAKEPDPSNPRENNILEYYRIGLMAQFDVGDFAVARTYYGKFLAEYPRDQRTFTVELLLKDLDKTEDAIRKGEPVPELSAIAAGAAQKGDSK